MDNYSDVSNKLCFKCDQKLLGNLSIAWNALNSMTVLWNKYQILIYERLAFKCATRIIEPEFQIHNLLLYNNHIACLDCSGNVHIISLKFKNPTQKKFKSSFQPRKQEILAFAQYNTDGVLTLQCSMDTLYLSFHLINKEFQIEKELQLLLDNNQTSIRRQENCILKSHSLTNLKGIEHIFDIKECPVSHSNLIIIIFDKLTVYAAITSPKMMEDETKLVKIYSCPTEICNIEILDGEDLKIVIGLSIGSIITVPLQKDRKAIVTHLNTAIYKFVLFEDNLLHTDGCTMWSTENVFSKRYITNKFFVKQVKDFIKVNDKIICTTFSNLIYMFTNDAKSYVNSQNTEEYFPADKLLNNTDCLNKIMEEIAKNNKLVKKLSKEENYITALSLSNRQDVMNNIINTKIVVYENYEDAVKEYVPVSLTEAVEEYFRPESMLFLINIVINASNIITNNILSNLFTDLKVHITFSTENKLLKTTSIKLDEHPNIVNYLIPLKNMSTRIYVNIVFVVNIPGTYDEKETAWTVLYRKHVVLKSENFILISNVADKVIHLNKTETTEELMLKTVQNMYGNEFTFEDVTNPSLNDVWSLYVKLPKNYPDVLRSSEYTDKYLNFKTSEYLTQQYTSDEFLKSKSNFVFMVGTEKVKLEIVNDGFSNPVLKITSGDLKVALDIRNFFAGIIYNDFNNYVPDEEFISQTFYTTVENVQNAVKNFVTKGLDPEELTSLANKFERNVIGALPL